MNLDDKFGSIINTDSIELMKRMIKDGFKIDFIFTDPPFGINFKGKKSNYNRNKNLVLDGYIDIFPDKYNEFSREWISCAYDLLTDDGSMLVVSGWNHLHHVLYALYDSGFILMNHLIWKYQFGVACQKKHVTSHYHILFVVKNKKKYYFNKASRYPEDVINVMSRGNISNRLSDIDTYLREGNPIAIKQARKEIKKVKDELKIADLVILRPEDKCDVITINREYHRGKKKNTTKLPDALVRYFIPFHVKKSDIVYDPFAGQGTIIKVCLELNIKKVFGSEISEYICELANQLINN